MNKHSAKLLCWGEVVKKKKRKNKKNIFHLKHRSLRHTKRCQSVWFVLWQRLTDDCSHRSVNTSIPGSQRGGAYSHWHWVGYALDQSPSIQCQDHYLLRIISPHPGRYLKKSFLHFHFSRQNEWGECCHSVIRNINPSCIIVKWWILSKSQQTPPQVGLSRPHWLERAWTGC